MGFPVASIIGTNFLAEHGWVIDFGKQEVILPVGDFGLIDSDTIRKMKEKQIDSDNIK